MLLVYVLREMFNAGDMAYLLGYGIKAVEYGAVNAFTFR